MYDPQLGRFTAVDPLVSERVEWSPYNAFRCNPIDNVDPNGTLDDWVQTMDENGNSTVKWDPNVTRATDPDLNENTYIGKTAYMTDASGNFVYGAQNGQTYTSAPLKEVTISSPAAYKNTAAYAVFGELASGKLNARPYGPSTEFPTPDYMGVSVNGNDIVGGGFGGNVTFGYVKGDGGFLNASFNQGVGFDISAGVSITAGNYSGTGKSTATSLAGPFTYQNLGPVLKVSAFQDVALKDQSLKLGTNWQGGSLNLSIGSKTAWGGSAGTSLTTKPLKLW